MSVILAIRFGWITMGKFPGILKDKADLLRCLVFVDVF